MKKRQKVMIDVARASVIIVLLNRILATAIAMTVMTSPEVNITCEGNIDR